MLGTRWQCLPDCQAGAATVRVVAFQVEVSVVLLNFCRGGRGGLARVVQLSIKLKSIILFKKRGKLTNWWKKSVARFMVIRAVTATDSTLRSPCKWILYHVLMVL